MFDAVRKDDYIMIVKNPFGEDGIDISDESIAERVGRRIRMIRTARGLSQTELGSRVGLTADRIQKYENGARKPKADLLKKIAGALEVSYHALAEPTTSNYISVMFALFDLENDYNLKIDKVGTKMCLSVDFGDSLYPYLKSWYEEYSRLQAELEVVKSPEEKSELLKEYRFWEWSYPKALTDEAEQMLKKERLKNKIEVLQAELEKLDNGK